MSAPSRVISWAKMKLSSNGSALIFCHLQVAGAVFKMLSKIPRLFVHDLFEVSFLAISLTFFFAGVYFATDCVSFSGGHQDLPAESHVQMQR